MTEKPTRRILPLTQILIILMGIVILYLLVDFGRLVGVSYQRRKELQRLEQRVAAGQERQAELQKELAYAQSAAAAEEWARGNSLAKPGEVPVVIVAPDADPALQTTEDRVENTEPALSREAWWELFFGSR